MLNPQHFVLDVHMEERNYDEREHDQRRKNYARDKRRKVVQEFLQSSEIPRRFRGIRRMERVGKLLQWSVPHQRQANQNHRQNLDGDHFAEEQFSVRNAFFSRGLGRQLSCTF